MLLSLLPLLSWPDERDERGEESSMRDRRRASAAISTSGFRRPSEQRISVVHPSKTGMKDTATQCELVSQSSIRPPDAVLITKLQGLLLAMSGRAGLRRALLTDPECRHFLESVGIASQAVSAPFERRCQLATSPLVGEPV